MFNIAELAIIGILPRYTNFINILKLEQYKILLNWYKSCDVHVYAKLL